MKRLLLSSLLLPLLAACGSGTEPLSCESPQYDAVLISQLRDEAGRLLQQNKPQLSSEEAQRLLSAIEFSLGSRQTTGKAPDSDQVLCLAILQLHIPADWHTPVSESMLLTQQQTGFREPADGLRPINGGYMVMLNYGLDPRTAQIARLTNPSSAEALARLPAYYLDHPTLSNNQSGAQHNIEQEVRQMALQADAEAQLEKLRQSHPRIQERLNQTWNNLPPDIRNALAAEHQAWQQQMANNCRRDAVYGVPTQVQEAERLKCEADMMLARIDDIGRQARARQQAAQQSNAAQNSMLAAELAAARQQHRAATNDLETLLRNLSPAVRATLNQNSWQRETTNRCRSGPSSNQAAATEALNCETSAILARIQEILQKAN